MEQSSLKDGACNKGGFGASHSSTPPTPCPPHPPQRWSVLVNRPELSTMICFLLTASQELGCWQLRLSAALPVSRLSATMHDCQNQNVVLFNCIKNTIGKLTGQTSPHVLINYTPTIWSFSNSINRILNSINECLRYLSTLLCVLLNSFGIFRKCFRVKYILHSSRSRLT